MLVWTIRGSALSIGVESEQYDRLVGGMAIVCVAFMGYMGRFS